MNTFKSSMSKNTVLKSMMTRKDNNMDSSFKPKSNTSVQGAKLGPGKSLTMINNQLTPKM